MCIRDRIRPHAQEIGDLVGYKLVRAIKDGELDPKKMHFIGHSAGGFVVVRAALVLRSFGLIPDDLQITMLDTPATDNADLLSLLETTKIDFYGTSSFTAIGVPGNGFHDNYTYTQVPVPAEITSSIDQHNYAYEWYIKTVLKNSEDLSLIHI